MKTKHKDLQPWLDYFEMLATYERKGLLEMQVDKGEAFITLPALCTLATGSPSVVVVPIDADSLRQQITKDIPAVVLRLRAYAGWKSQQGTCYLERPFAVHVVKDRAPFDMLYTILLTRRHLWWRLFSKGDHFETIFY